jgi:hypothetical protein
MAKPWDMHVSVDAVGSDSCRVRARTVHRDGSGAHLLVRAGPVMVYALDPHAVTDLATAWAAAQVRGAHLLPVELPGRRPPARTPLGAAYPVAEVVVEGRQRWNVQPPEGAQRYLQVRAGWLTMRIHDRVALDTQVRAWAEASAFGTRVFGRARSTPFDELLEQQQIRAVREAAARDDTRIERPHRSRDRGIER